MSSAQQSTKFTIVIPTRERCDTLYWSLHTCVSQRYENLEILVSDNYSQDATRDVVMSFNDPRIRYVNTGKRVSMTANWEFALAHVEDGYVTYIGDDDGMMPNALVELNQLICETKAEAVAWQKADYFWPTYWEATFRNTLKIPLGSACKSLSASKMLAKLLTFQVTYIALPCIYNSVVHRDVIRRAQNGTERFFRSINPDVYSSIALAAVIDRYIYSHRPYSVGGTSGHSGGASFFYSSQVTLPQSHQTTATSTVAQVAVSTTASINFLAENDLAFHPTVIIAPSLAVLTAEAALQARDHVAAARHFTIDIQSMLTHAMQEAATLPAEKYTNAADAVRQMGALHNLSSFVEDLIARHSNSPEKRYPIIGLDIVFKTLRVRTEEFAIDNIFTAAQLCRSILTLRAGRYYSFLAILRTSADLATKLARRWLGVKMVGLANRRSSLPTAKVKG